MVPSFFRSVNAMNNWKRSASLVETNSTKQTKLIIIVFRLLLIIVAIFQHYILK